MRKFLIFITVLLVIVSCSKENYDQKNIKTNSESAKMSTSDSIAFMNAGGYLKSTITARELDSIAKTRSKSIDFVRKPAILPGIYHILIHLD